MPCENNARKRSKTMAFRCTPEEHKLICEMVAWSGMSRQDYIIAKLTDTQVEARPSVSVQKAFGEGVDDSVSEPLKRAAPLEGPATAVMDAESNTASIFGMGRR